MLRSIWQFLKHHYYLFVQGRKLHVPFKHLLVHDLNNRQSWCFDGTPCYMPPEYANEMLADWSATSLEHGKAGDVTKWYYSHHDEIKLHPETRKHLESLGYETGLLLVTYEYWKKVHGVDANGSMA